MTTQVQKSLGLDELLRFKSLISDINTSETPGAHSLGHRLQAGAGVGRAWEC